MQVFEILLGYIIHTCIETDLDILECLIAGTAGAGGMPELRWRLCDGPYRTHVHVD